MPHWGQKIEISVTLKVCPIISLDFQARKMAVAHGARLWKDDIDLKNALEDLVKRSYKKSEILVTVRKDFPYPWERSPSIRGAALRLWIAVCVIFQSTISSMTLVWKLFRML